MPNYLKAIRNTSPPRFLQTKHLTLPPTHPFGCGLSDVTFDIRKGEILGIAGVAGNGQEDLLEALSGEDHRPPKDSILLNGLPVGHLDAGKRRALGMSYVPTNRLGQGAVPEMSLEENTLLTHTQELTTLGFIRRKLTKALTQKLIRTNQVKCRHELSQAKSLSGGNLQKFIIGREVHHQPTILICAHPTWGVDIGAASAIHRQLIALRDAGAAVLVISEDIDELFVICDRLAAIYEGRVSPIVKTDETSIEQIGQWIAGGFIQHEETTHA
ncbi:ATP-binding cassette domain-containing protein [Vibrio sp. PP-XX7]